MTNDQLINKLLVMFRQDLRHFADLNLRGNLTADERLGQLTAELVGCAEDYARYLEERRREMAADNGL